MAIASGNNREKIYMLFGIPSGGASYEANAIATLWGPFGETYSHSAIVTALDAKLTASDAATYPTTQVEIELGYFDNIRENPNLHISQGSSGVQGRIIDNKNMMETIRQRVAGLIGFIVPEGGFRYCRPASNDCRIGR